MNNGKASRLEEMKNGDQSAFRYFYDKYSASVCYFISRSIGDGAAAEDIMHDVFINLWNGREGISSEYHLAMWLKGQKWRYVRL